MDIQASKIELAKLILTIEDPELIRKIQTLLEGEASDFANNLTMSEREEIALALKLMNAGHKTSLDDFLARKA